MEIVLRSICMYLILLLLLRLTTRRLMRTATTLDMALVFIFGGLAAQAIVLDDHSITASFFAMGAISLVHVAITIAKSKFPLLGQIAEGVPLIVYHEGQWVEETLKQTRVQKSDIMVEARQNGYTDLHTIRYVVVEPNGGITLLKGE